MSTKPTNHSRSRSTLENVVGLRSWKRDGAEAATVSDGIRILICDTGDHSPRFLDRRLYTHCPTQEGNFITGRRRVELTVNFPVYRREADTPFEWIRCLGNRTYGDVDGVKRRNREHAASESFARKSIFNKRAMNTRFKSCKKSKSPSIYHISTS
jgi:hypothetical protein